MGLRARRVRLIGAGVVGGIVVFVIAQMLLPWPLGIYMGITLFSIIFGVCIAVAFAGIKKDRRTSLEEEGNVKAIALLKERLAKGEITKDEYDSLFDKFTKS